MISSLDQFVSAPPPPPKPREEPKVGLVQRLSIPANLENAFFVGADYDGERRSVFIKLYEPQTQKLHLWYDNTGHLPYCFSKKTVQELQRTQKLTSNPGFLRLENATRFDAIEGKQIPVTVIYATDPLSIGGRQDSIRESIPAWEADIRYVENYIYDRKLEPGMTYSIRIGQLEQEETQSALTGSSEFLRGGDELYQSLMARWLRMLEAPFPNYRRVALDIEVHSPLDTRVPDPELAEYKVICASLRSSDDVRRVLILRKPGDPETAEGTTEFETEFFDTEEELIATLFKAINSYPFVLTFNGDDFDLRYLYNRALHKLGFTLDQVPIQLRRDSAGLKYGIHIDLYRFFFNRSIQVYAFANKYREVTLNAISEALLDTGKVEINAPVSRLSYDDLARYCLQDSELVMDLTTFDGEVVMKLITALSRISYLPMEDMTRQGVSGWIRSMMFKEHRDRGYLIPRPVDIKNSKGETSTTAIIKGKKYKGGMVVDPVAGVHFNVAVLDFASLYPSIMKTWNLGYETILCNHPDCKNNKVPDTNHWVCRHRKAMESQLIGSLRDLRIKWYKPRSKDKTLSPNTLSWYQVVQSALKVVLNASYGVFGADRFSLYCPPLAESVAAVGRYSISNTIEEAKRLGIEVFYGDTDSLFLGTPTRGKLEQLIQWSKDKLGMELEVDKTYRYVALSNRKKNYLGVQEDNRVDIKGLTGKKRHIPEFLKTAFSQLVVILGEVRSPADFDQARTKIRDLVRDSYGKLRNKKYSLDELAFNMMIGKSIGGYTKNTPQHVKAAQQLTKTGPQSTAGMLSSYGVKNDQQPAETMEQVSMTEADIRAGDLVSFVKVVTGTGVKPIQLASLQEIDVSKYTEYIRSTFEQVLDAVGLDYEELTGAKKLESFFPGV